MRRTVMLSLCLGLSGCGFSYWHDVPFVAGPDKYQPVGDSENMRRAQGMVVPAEPLRTEPGNLWPSPSPEEPTLETLEREGGRLPNEAAPPPLPPQRGSSTPPANPAPVPVPSIPPVPQSPAPVPPASPGSPLVQTPGGTGVVTGGTSAYKTITLPNGGTAIVVPNGNGTSTVINSNGTVETIPSPK